MITETIVTKISTKFTFKSVDFTAFKIIAGLPRARSARGSPAIILKAVKSTLLKVNFVEIFVTIVSVIILVIHG